MTTTDGYPDQVIFAPGPASRYQWVAAGPNPCSRCAQLDGSVRTLGEWQASVQPGLHKHCHCYLTCVDTVESGIAYTPQFSALCLWNLMEALSFTCLDPHPIWHHGGVQEPENADDLAPIQTGVGPPTGGQPAGPPPPKSKTKEDVKRGY